MKLTLKLPIVRQNPSGTWDRYQTDASLEIESTYENRSELREQADTLLAELSSEYLLVDVLKVQELLERTQRKLSDINSQMQVAQNQLERLTRFLNGFGVDATKAFVAFDEQLKLRSAEDSGDGDENDDGDVVPY